MRIAIVNDMAMAVEALRRVVSLEHEIAWVATNGKEAVERCAADRPDLTLMDLIMPVMDGVEATRRIMKETPCPILVVTASIDSNYAKVFLALGAGALDVVSTPARIDGREHGGAELLQKINVLRTLIEPARSSKTDRPRAANRGDWSTRDALVVIGCSAGGPAALADIFRRIGSDFPAGIVIVQHIDKEFTPALVDWLAAQTTIPVRIARDGDRPQRGVALIAGTDDHILMRSDGTLQYTPEPIGLVYRPSVDVFFESVAQHWRGKTVGVLLTGMGRDGAVGLKSLKASGARTLVQDRETSVVYGMPKAAAEAGAADEIVPLPDIPQAIKRALNA